MRRYQFAVSVSKLRRNFVAFWQQLIVGAIYLYYSSDYSMLTVYYNTIDWAFCHLKQQLLLVLALLAADFFVKDGCSKQCQIKHLMQIRKKKVYKVCNNENLCAGEHCWSFQLWPKVRKFCRRLTNRPFYFKIFQTKHVVLLFSVT